MDCQHASSEAESSSWYRKSYTGFLKFLSENLALTQICMIASSIIPQPSPPPPPPCRPPPLSFTRHGLSCQETHPWYGRAINTNTDNSDMQGNRKPAPCSTIAAQSNYPQMLTSQSAASPHLFAGGRSHYKKGCFTTQQQAPLLLRRVERLTTNIPDHSESWDLMAATATTAVLLSQETLQLR